MGPVLERALLGTIPLSLLFHAAAAVVTVLGARCSIAPRRLQDGACLLIGKGSVRSHRYFWSTAVDFVTETKLTLYVPPPIAVGVPSLSFGPG